MEKNIITVSLKDGTSKDMELVLIYKDDLSKTDYILYKELNEENECYAAKYKIKNNLYELDPKLTQKEITKLELLLNSTLKEVN